MQERWPEETSAAEVARRGLVITAREILEVDWHTTAIVQLVAGMPNRLQRVYTVDACWLQRGGG